MWLTGFDVPSLATLYLDKPLKAHTLSPYGRGGAKADALYLAARGYVVVAQEISTRIQRTMLTGSREVSITSIPMRR